jgi:predicted transcriptional regulator of viral defense system
MSEAELKPIILTSPRILRIFEAQHGVASRKQLLSAGLRRGTIGRGLRGSVLVAMRPGVYRFAATAESDEQRLIAATLAVAGSAISHRSAAALHGLAGFRSPHSIEVTTTTGAREKGIRVHRRSELPKSERSTVRGVPVTNVARTLFDLCDVCEESEVARAIDDAFRRKLVTFDALERLLASRSSRGRKSVSLLRDLLAERGPEDARAASELESRFLRIIRRAKLPMPEVNVDVYDEDGDRLARPDFLYRDRKLAIFTDGKAFHADRTAFENDRSQANALTANGWRVLRYTWRQVRNGPAIVLALRGVLGLTATERSSPSPKARPSTRASRRTLPTRRAIAP